MRIPPPLNPCAESQEVCKMQGEYYFLIVPSVWYISFGEWGNPHKINYLFFRLSSSTINPEYPRNG